MPEVLSIQPTAGYSIGGLFLVVNFAWVGLVSQNTMSCGCFFDDVWVTAVTQNSTHMSCLVPPKRSGGTSVLLRISIEGASSWAKESIFFTYNELPEVVAVQPLDVVTGRVASITLFGNPGGFVVSNL